MDYPLYGHPLGNPQTPNQAENAPSTWPWWVFLVGIVITLAVILTCAAICTGIYMWHSQRRIKKEEQRLAEVEVAERGEAGREQNGTANMAREQNSPKAAITQFNAAAVVEVWNVDAELEEDRSSWRVKTIKAWVDCVPAGLGPDMADLETQLLRARQYEETWMVRGRRLHRSKVVFADELNLPNRDHISNCIGEGSS